jgi:hypothetical protein
MGVNHPRRSGETPLSSGFAADKLEQFSIACSPRRQEVAILRSIAERKVLQGSKGFDCRQYQSAVVVKHDRKIVDVDADRGFAELIVSNSRIS